MSTGSCPSERSGDEALQGSSAHAGAFEHWFGKYPFYEDSYKLVTVSYPGMEHQSSVTYGNWFRNGYLHAILAPAASASSSTSSSFTNRRMSGSATTSR
jgi:hypothetical protein